MTTHSTDHPTESSAVHVARRYFETWSGGDFDAAMTLVAPDITCHTPAGSLAGAEAFRAFMGPFAATVRSVSLVAVYGDEDQAVLVYDTKTPLVADAPGAEWHRVVDGRIAELRIIFDRLPFELARHESAAPR